ncbi:chaperone modulator CbpM [Aestuariivirga sp.]|uniref:chaperone modulator CbpM n=1 Tax=Aestuariivirga sp. TaxID=2650926 RepID=UPI0039E699D0
MAMDKQRFLTTSGIQIQTLDLWIEQHWLVPHETAQGLEFSEVDVARAAFIRQMKDDFGANDAGIDVILHLLDQIHGLRQALSELREGLDKPV